MALNTSVKVGPEVRLYISSSAQSLLSIDMQDSATDTGVVWEELDFVRFPIDRTEPKEIVDIYKRFTIDHTKKGRDQRKTFSFVVAFQNTSRQIRRYKDKECLIRIAWHVEDAATADEFEYLTSFRVLNLTRNVPDGEVNERVDGIFAKWGNKIGP